MKRLTLFYVSFLIFGLIFVTLSNAKISFKTVAGIWLFDEKDGADIKDSSQNGNDGEVAGDPEHVEGKFGSALSLNGSTDWVTVPDSDSLDLQEAWTITSWIYVNDTENNWGHILGKRDPALAVVNYAFRTDDVGTGWDAYFATNGAWKGIWNVAAVEKGEWFYMTATYDGKDVISIYENGVQIGTLTGMGTPAPANEVDVIIGGWKDSVTELLDGMLDEVLLIGDMINTDDMIRLMDVGAERALGIVSVDEQGKLTTEWGKIKTSR